MSIQRKAMIAGAAAGAVALPFVLAGKVGKRRRDILQEPQRSPSYWMATIPELTPFPTLSGEMHVDVAVVGGGFTGLATAYYLKQHDPSISVALLESQRIGSGSSTRNTGGVGRQLRGQESNDATQRGYELIRSFAEREELPFDLDEQVPALRLHRTMDTIEDPDLTGDDLARQIGSSFYQAAEAFTASSLHPGKLVTSLVHANRQLGVDLYEHSPVISIEKNGGRPLLKTPDGRVLAGNVVLATNAYTPQLGVAEDQLLVMHQRVIVTRHLTDEEWERSGLGRWSMRMEHGTYYTHTVRATPDRRFFFRHVLGHRPMEAVDWTVSERDIQAGHRELLRRYPWLEDAPIEYAWHGITARTRDLWPVVGEVDDHVYLSAGYNGGGVMPAHYFGYLLARRILGHHDEDLDQLQRLPDEHPSWPPELLRHTIFQGAMRYRRMLDGRR
ncbi:MAG: FAD-binding oxidoreductase [Thermomicrobiales bacterium]